MSFSLLFLMFSIENTNTYLYMSAHFRSCGGKNEKVIFFILITIAKWWNGGTVTKSNGSAISNNYYFRHTLLHLHSSLKNFIMCFIINNAS